MNTSDQKAQELIDKFYDKIDDFPVECGMYCLGGTIDKQKAAKQCAIICCEEIIASWAKHNGSIDKDFYPKEFDFWYDVIEKIKRYED